jgi:ParB-like chromosome segregation protein Spo0J
MGSQTQDLLFTPEVFSVEANQEIMGACKPVFALLSCLDQDELIATLNALRLELHEYSPFSKEPVDCVQWVDADLVQANDYNPNVVAPPEMKLLEVSIEADGFTQPIVAWKNKDVHEVVDGFHRNRVGKESKKVRTRLNGYLPLSIINREREERSDRIAATIRHNRARGKHQVAAMSDIVVELKRRNWGDERISRELGMEPDEILRLCQITGLQELFSDQDFSKAWTVEGEIAETDFEELTDDISTYGEEETRGFRTVNTNDPQRIFHTHDKWECYKAGFYATKMEGMTRQQCEEAYRDFLVDIPRFEAALKNVISEWKCSCEHYLTNVAMNRIAWLGQASMCYATGVPSMYRGGFYLLTKEQQTAANQCALVALNVWLKANERDEVTLEEAMSGERQSDIY